MIPFNISCGSCFMCDHGLQSQCETTQNRDQGTGAALFGYSKLYGEVAGGQAEYLRVPQAQYTHIKVPDDGPDERYVYLSDVLPTAWQGVEYADVPDGGTLVVLGLGPIGSMACRIASHRKKCTVIGVDLVTERLDRARRYCSEVVDLRHDDADEVVKSYTSGRGADAVIDAVGMEAHGSPVATAAQTASGFLPSPVGRAVMKHAGVDRLAAFNMAIALVRRGGTISLSGVYGGAADPINLMTLFDKQIQAADGPGQRQEVDTGHHAVAHRRRPARRRAVRHPPAAALSGARCVRDLPEEGGRHGQGGPHTLTRGYPIPLVSAGQFWQHYRRVSFSRH